MLNALTHVAACGFLKRAKPTSANAVPLAANRRAGAAAAPQPYRGGFRFDGGDDGGDALNLFD
jgi:hypothetical protein